jgi:hypothetical protein
MLPCRLLTPGDGKTMTVIAGDSLTGAATVLAAVKQQTVETIVVAHQQRFREGAFAATFRALNVYAV